MAASPFAPPCFAEYPEADFDDQIKVLKNWVRCAEGAIVPYEEIQVWLRELDLMNEYRKREEEIPF